MTGPELVRPRSRAKGRKRSLPLHRRILNPLRTALFAVSFFLLELLCFAYQVLLIAIPCGLSRAYRRRFHHGLWNWLIAFWGRNTCRLARWTTGMRVTVEGHIPPGPHIVVANHQSSADIFVLFEVLRSMNLKFVVKKELLRWLFVVSYALRDGGFGVVDFGNRQKTLEGMKEFARSLVDWEGSPLIFPEGIRSFDGSLSRFKTAGLRLLIRETDLPVLPVVIDGIWGARSAGRFFLHLPGVRCHLSILPPMTIRDELDTDELVGRIEDSMREELEKMRAETRPGGTDERPVERGECQ